MKKLLTLLSIVAVSVGAQGAPARPGTPPAAARSTASPEARRVSPVVNPAPDLSYLGAGNKNATLKALRGQSVVLLIAESAKNGDFKKQLRYLQEIYAQFASKQVVFIAALKNTEHPILSNVPFAQANSGPDVAARYNCTDAFNLVIIGRDGNIDYQTPKVCTGERVRDVIQNSFAVQAAERR